MRLRSSIVKQLFSRDRRNAKCSAGRSSIMPGANDDAASQTLEQQTPKSSMQHASSKSLKGR